MQDFSAGFQILRNNSGSIAGRVNGFKVKQSFLHLFRPLNSGDKCKAPSERPRPIDLRMLGIGNSWLEPAAAFGLAPLARYA
jgi:hypothetical protein